MRWELFFEEYNKKIGLLTLLLFMKFWVVIDGLLDQQCKCIKIKYYVIIVIEHFSIYWFGFSQVENLNLPFFVVGINIPEKPFSVIHI